MQREFSDETILTITKILYDQFKADQEESRLNEDQIHAFKRQYIKPLYPHETVYEIDGSKTIQKYSLSRICCELSPGHFCCGSTTKPDHVYRHLGLGMCMYFKFIKHLTILFLFISLLSTVPITFYYMVSANNSLGVLDGYQQFLFSSTIGALSSQRLKCMYSEAFKNVPINLKIACPVGNIALLGPVFTTNSLANVNNCKEEIDKWTDQPPQYSITSYTNSSICNDANSECNVSLTIKEALKHPRVSYTFQCLYAQYALGGLTISKDIVVYVSVAIDLVIALAIVLFLFSENLAEGKEVQQTKQTELSVKDFSLEICGFTRENIDHEFNLFVQWLNDHLKMTTVKRQ